jgi:acyl dehydratase
MAFETAAEPVRPRTVAELRALEGTELGPTAWYEITQERIDAFAKATEDFQWIHVDPDRAASSPLGSTIAHGLFTLSLGPKFMEELMVFDGFAHSLNYGYDKVRFPAPVPVGSRLRMRATITAVADVPGGAQVTTTQTMEIEGGSKPVCVAASVGRFVERTDGATG